MADPQRPLTITGFEPLDPRGVSATKLPVRTWVNGQEIVVPDTLGESFTHFGQGLAETVDPRPLFEALLTQREGQGALGSLGSNLGELVGGVGMAQQQQYEQALEALQAGDYAAGLGHGLAWLTPLLGPAAAQAVETAQAGDYARASGQAVGLLAPMKLPARLGGRTVAGTMAQGAGELLGEAGTRLADAGVRKYAKELTPQVGREKLRFAEMAKRAAPVLAREKGFGALTSEGLYDKIAEARFQRRIELNQAYQGVPKTRAYPTAPILKRLDEAIKKLQIRGMGANAGTIDPVTRAERIRTLRIARRQVQQLGNLINIDNLRSLATAFQEGGEAAYTPNIVSDYLKARGKGMGWADAGRAVREFLVEREPQTRVANARFSIIEAASDAMEAFRDTEFVRPARGRTYTAGIIGGLAGHGMGGASETLMGAAIAMMVAKVEHSATGQITLARTLTRVGDLVRRGRQAEAVALLGRTAEGLGVIIPGINASRPQGGPTRQPTTTTAPTTPEGPLRVISGGPSTIGPT